MTNKNYIQGRDFEYQVMRAMKICFPEPKYTIIRTAGSHSKYDVVILKHMGKEFFGIQCKTKRE